MSSEFPLYGASRIPRSTLADNRSPAKTVLAKSQNTSSRGEAFIYASLLQEIPDSLPLFFLF